MAFVDSQFAKIAFVTGTLSRTPGKLTALTRPRRSKGGHFTAVEGREGMRKKGIGWK